MAKYHSVSWSAPTKQWNVVDWQQGKMEPWQHKYDNYWFAYAKALGLKGQMFIDYYDPVFGVRCRRHMI